MRFAQAQHEASELREAQASLVKESEAARAIFDEKLMELSAVTAGLESERAALRKRGGELTASLARETNRADSLQRLAKVKDKELLERANKTAHLESNVHEFLQRSLTVSCVWFYSK